MDDKNWEWMEENVLRAEMAWQKLLEKSKKQERKRILRKIAEYEYHKDEVHCTCLGALKEWIINLNVVNKHD